MPKSHEKRVDALDNAGLGVPDKKSFADELRRARLRAAAGEAVSETPITPDLMEDPVDTHSGSCPGYTKDSHAMRLVQARSFVRADLL